MIHPRELAGKRILHVTTSWHHHPDTDPSLLHAWLELEGLGPVRCHTGSNGTLDLRPDRPHDPYDMEQYGHVTVGPAPADSPLNDLVGQQILEVGQVREPTIGIAIGIILRLESSCIRILNLADDLVVARDTVPGTVETERPDRGPDPVVGHEPAGPSSQSAPPNP